MRVRPRRETRGVSRSKCGDLITACVPVSWATSIIVNESTDAMDFYDGFGTTELVIGIRAYQWGWEYYYPKDIDLNYNIKKNYSTFIGNSLKYNTTSHINLEKNNLWKFYQNKNGDSLVLPAHTLLFSLDNYKLLNFLNFNDVGSNVLTESSAFKKTKSFFKHFTSNTFNTTNALVSNYNWINNLYFSTTSFFNSYVYGLKRHHTFLTSITSNSSQITFLNYQNYLKFLKYNYGINKCKKFLDNVFTSNFFFENQDYSQSVFTLYFNKLLNKDIKLKNYRFLSKLNTYPETLSLINNDSSKKFFKYPLLKTLNLLSKKNSLNNKKFFSDLNLENNTSFLKSNVLQNKTFLSKTYTLFSSNQSILTSNKNLRSFSNLSSTIPSLQFSKTSNIAGNFLFTLNDKTSLKFFAMYNVIKSKWVDSAKFITLSSNQTFMGNNLPPINYYNFNANLNYDNTQNTFVKNIPVIFQGKEDNIPNSVTATYWNFYFDRQNVEKRFSNDFKYFNVANFFYFPIFNFSYDYDFRNWQSIELLEDLFWESSYPFYVYDEYSSIFNEFYIFKDSIKHENYFFETNFASKTFFNDLTVKSYHNFIFFDDFVSNVTFFKLENFLNFQILSNLVLLDDTYESFKFFKLASNFANNNYLTTFASFVKPRIFFSVFNMFRSDYDDTNWTLDDINFLKLDLNFFTANFKFSEFKNLPFLESNILNNLADKPYTRFDNNFNIRNTVKNAIVTHNALQKVFRARLDEGRSNTKLLEFDNFFEKQPYLSSSRINYEKILGKTNQHFYKTNFYKTNFISNFNFAYNLTTSLNYYIYDFPFLMATKSDASRYMWFDWFAKWGFCEVQPSSSARYAIHGMPYFNKYFNFTSSQNELLNESESYFLRLSKARRNYLPNWTYTPYFYLKNNVWYKNNLFFNLSQLNNTLFLAQAHLINSLWYETSLAYEKSYALTFNSTISNINSYAKSTWKPFTDVNSYYFVISNLLDILTKREYLYRQFLANQSKIVNLPIHAQNNNNSELVKNIKTLFFFIDPIIYNNEYSRDLYYNSLNLFNFYVIKSVLTSSNLMFNTVIDFFTFYFFNSNTKNFNETDTLLFKNQYRPLRKGINNMLRLHATGAIAMPIEIRLQILASSKDVIHSWAIPSAGIKIDCVPGYSSHKVMIFLVSGIFWGQCMEICGRYHHWMPIVVYFMKRDLFFLWCTHFVFTSNISANLNDRQFNDQIRLVSYNKNSWLTELLS